MIYEPQAKLSSHNMIALPLKSKTQLVRQVFEDTPRYLRSRKVDILIRIETVRALAASICWSKLLDVGCGDGTISLQLLTSESSATMLDLSAGMVARVKANVPKALAKNVEVRNEDFIAAPFEAHSFDLIVTVGVMAHVDSPEEFIAKIKHVLRPGGNLILEFTDCRHLVGRLGRLWGGFKELLAPPKYPTNRICRADLVQLFDRHHLRPIAEFRYARVPLPGFDRIVGPDMQCKLLRFIFGDCSRNTNSWLGNEHIFLLASD